MKIIMKMILVVIISGSNVSIFPQSYTELEKEIDVIKHQLRQRTNELDSLNVLYNNRVNEIDIEKNKSDVDEDRVAQLMANSISLTNKIDSKLRIIILQKSELRDKKKELDIVYTNIIDSLKVLEGEKNIEIDENNLNLEILTLMEKKLNNVADMDGLQYNPSDIIGFELNPPQNKDVYSTYIENAIIEVNTKMNSVSSLLVEIEQANKLRRKVNKFISDSEFNPDILRNQNTGNLITSRTFEGGVFDPTTLETNYKSYSFLLNQLSTRQFMVPGSRELNNNYITNEKEITVESFIELLKEVNARLQKYNELLSDKLSDLNNADN